MEKLIYVLADSADDVTSRVARISTTAVEATRKVGGERIAILVPDEAEEIRSRCAARISGDFGRLSAAFECWLPTLDDRGAIEEALSPHAGELWGYLVTESTMVACPHADKVADGERVPGITQWGINDKPAKVDLDSFYREWAVHSEISFDLHPFRDSYIRNAIVRKLTEATPQYLGIVLERFPSLDVFVDESRYFGDPAVTQKMFEHVPMFYDFETAITGGLSEYRWA